MPHSEIPGSKPVCGSPELFAAYHVLHRHLAPRHSPYALSSLTINLENSYRSSNSFCGLFDGMNPSRHCSPASALTGVGEALSVCGRKKLPFAGYSVVKETLEAASRQLPLPAALRTRRRRVSFTQMIRRPIFRPPELSILRVPPARCKRKRLTDLRLASLAQALSGERTRARRLVENTGLEPVTSWLQTRRSPS